MVNSNWIMGMPYFNSISLVNYLVGNRCGSGTWINNFLISNKIGENPVVTPSTSIQVIRPSAPNRYLESVTVNATTTSTT
jgi:hypothetical protein